MNLTLDNIQNCRDFKIIQRVFWDSQGDIDVILGKRSLARPHSGWGFIICSPSSSEVSDELHEASKLYGVIASVCSDHIQEDCVGIQIEAHHARSGLSNFSLACGLSIINRAKLGLGDGVVVSGVNALAMSVMAAAKAQGCRIACLLSKSDVENSSRMSIRNFTDAIMDFGVFSSLDSRFDEFISSSRGKISFIDVAGRPNEVSYMASRLVKFGSLVLCRSDLLNTPVIDIYRDILRKSANISYWTRPETIADALIFSELCQRAGRLINSERVTPAFQ